MDEEAVDFWVEFENVGPPEFADPGQFPEICTGNVSTVSGRYGMHAIDRVQIDPARETPAPSYGLCKHCRVPVRWNSDIFFWCRKDFTITEEPSP